MLCFFQSFYLRLILHINIHEFRLQFKTISFLATFGLLVSLFLVGFLTAYFLHLPLPVAFLFGALISATDPIAVLALFKTLGAAKRLALIADGESMFNDATAVIAFKTVSVFAIGGAYLAPSHIFGGFTNFVSVFFGSIAMGAIGAYILSLILSKVKSDRLIVNSISAALALGGFVASEYFFHLSGVITTVIAGIIFF